MAHWMFAMVDVDECRQQPNLCDHECRNLPGSYQCSCQVGYALIGRSKCQGYYRSNSDLFVGFYIWWMCSVWELAVFGCYEIKMLAESKTWKMQSPLNQSVDSERKFHLISACCHIMKPATHSCWNYIQSSWAVTVFERFLSLSMFFGSFHV
jgi:hypothetical protein